MFYQESFQYEKNRLLLDKFITGKGLNKLFVYYQVQEQAQTDDIKDTGAQDPVLFFTTGDIEKIQEKAVWFLRIQSPADERDEKKPLVDNENDIIFGEITPNTIPMMNSLMESMYAR